MNTESHMALFPQEIFDIIIHESGRDVSTLRSCALVCRAFLPSSQASIFCDVELADCDTSRVQRLYLTLLRSPHLRGMVRQLTISDAGGRADWYPTVIALLGILDSVTSVALLFAAHWNNMPEEMRVAICAICQRSHLVSLRLPATVTSLTEFTQLVSSQTLRKLWLEDIAWVRLQENMKASMSGLHSLQELVLSAHDLNSLPQDCSIDLSLSKLENLHVFTISLLIDERPERMPHLLAGLCDEGLKSLTRFEVGIYVISDVADFPTIDWAPLSCVLTSDAHFPALGYVGFGVMFSASDAAEQKIIEDIRRAFPRFQAEGILNAR
ncbi:hypothetical protein B0H19DRAFT_1140469 [Mycena capillaripes]|nr:hypothetical protein B0H19DRAFT_1140469 [Mycena capillaripes]